MKASPELERMYRKARAAVDDWSGEFQPRVIAMALTAVLAEVVGGAYDGEPAAITRELGRLIDVARAQRRAAERGRR